MSKQELFEVGKIQPHSIDIEETVLGSLMIEKDTLAIALNLLKVEVFYARVHQTIFNAITRIHSRKEPVDILTVVNELKKLKEIDNIGGAYYITQLTNRVGDTTNIEYHCAILLQHYFKRELIRISTYSIKKAYDEYTDIFDLKEKIVNEIKNIDSFIQSHSITNNNDTIDNVLSDVKLSKSKGGIIGYSTGIKNLDWVIMGLKPKFKYTIAALSGEGKTSLAKAIGINLAYQQNVPGVFFSLEVTKEMLMLVCISEILQIPNQLLQRGDISEHDEKRIKELKNTLFSTNFLIDDRGGLSPQEMRSTLIKLKEKYNIKWFIIDYLGLEKLKGNQHKGKTKEAIISDITIENKNIAKELDLICIELCQLNKEGSKRSSPRPFLSDIRDSGMIEASADVVLFLFRPEKHNMQVDGGEIGHSELIVAKNRFGPLKTVAAKYKAEYTQFINNDDGVELDTTVQPEDTVSF